MNPLLNVRDLTLTLPNGTELLHGITLHVDAGETVGLVGESGSGKSLTARMALALWPESATFGGSVTVDGKEVVGASEARILDVRRNTAAMIFQDPRAGINPMRTIGDHMTETLQLVERKSPAEARARAIELLRAVQLPDPEAHLKQFPHEFSGGMLQRVMIAGALTSSPKLLICDEPTTALDVTTQAEIIQVLATQRAERGMGMLFITHDLNLAASICDRVYVMQGGNIVEQGDARQVFFAPAQPYTQRLVAATPTVDVPPAPASLRPELGAPRREAPGVASATAGGGVGSEGQDPGSTAPTALALEVSGVSKTYLRRGKPPVQAVRDASLQIPRGGSLGVVGESGSGKSTLARMVVGLEEADAGGIRIAGAERTRAPRGRDERLARAKSVQMVFQDPYLSLDPRIPAGRAIEDVLHLHTSLSTADAKKRVRDLLEAVGLGETHAQARPKTLSGGQRQRVAIARAIAIEPDVLVMDEATSALDVSVQAQVLDMVASVRRERGLTVMFISHDLGVVRRVCDETVVMRRGEIVEQGPTEQLLLDPRHEYTRLLLDSVPRAA
ncbi:ABC transporter ATP-binding protein [Microbacterium mangrovi]|uniref:ABC transporter ATP-binding protein n=1 Tax=Microbacterium mangrovi TaxID=1348253 RepID=A0A0B2ADB0_9MICO|nr:ABC transporter ATP-binding protein [Microbacterium mangrovi]KHK99567.1 ABC transporter ATP-binding protein [Microbacterium mangrovi]